MINSSSFPFFIRVKYGALLSEAARLNEGEQAEGIFTERTDIAVCLF